MRRAMMLLLSSWALGGCEDQTPHLTLTLALEARDDDDHPVAGARFWLDGQQLGQSDARGALRARLRGQPGQRFALTIACPAAYRTPQAERELSLSQLRDARPLQLTARCQPLSRRAALIVSARGVAGARLPVLVDGRSAGQLEPDGTAHILITRRPHSEIRVGLDSRLQPALVPRNPVRSFRLGDADEILLFDQDFSRPKRRTRHRPPPASPPRRPYRIH